MNVQITMADFPQDKKNCATCERKGRCARSDRRHPNGQVLSDIDHKVSGIIYCCPQYEGRWA